MPKTAITHDESTSSTRAVPTNMRCIPEPQQLFEDPTLPLVLDLGCGYGTTLIGMAMTKRKNLSLVDESTAQNNSIPDFAISTSTTPNHCNLLGIDMNKEAIAYAISISNRWFPSSSTNCKPQFIYANSYDVLAWALSSYPGRIAWIMCQFPSPYKFVASTDGNDSCSNSDDDDDAAKVGDTNGSIQQQNCNMQLPSKKGGSFQVTPQLLSMIEKCFLKQTLQKQLDPCTPVVCVSEHEHGHGCLYIQSNAEDVALYCRKLITEHCHNMSIATSVSQCTFPDGSNASHLSLLEEEWVTSVEQISQEADIRFGSRLMRYLRNVDVGSETSRAVGSGWLLHSPLPLAGRTETEAACSIEGKSVHRVCFVSRV